MFQYMKTMLRDSSLGSCLLLQIRAQNAAIMLSPTQHGVLFEAFELLPTNSAVMRSSGRLQRSFPGSAVIVSHAQFDTDDFQATLCQMISTMDRQESPGTRPIVYKTGKGQEEVRDTVHPKMVSELLMNILRAIGKPAASPVIRKHTREEVLWHKSMLPWHRSPTWLMIRVACQLKLSDTPLLYKSWMLSMLAHVTKMALTAEVKSDTLFCMKAKISQRLMKLGNIALMDGLLDVLSVQNILANTQVFLSQRCAAMQLEAYPQLPLLDLRHLVFQKDTVFMLPELDLFLASLKFEPNINSMLSFLPPPDDFKLFMADSLPKVSSESVFELLSIEEWVGRNLQTWLSKNMKSTLCCAQIGTLIREYHSKASATYAEDPEAYSVMCLTLFELWMACDKSACSQHSLLTQYSPEVPIQVCNFLLLPQLKQMQRIGAVEWYVEQRKRQASTNRSALSDFGSADVFAVKHFQQSQHHQDLLRRIEEDASKLKAEKVTEFDSKKRQYQDLMRTFQLTSCACQYRYSRRAKKIRTAKCDHCSYNDQAKALQINLYEWPLPSDRYQVENVVFELDPPAAFADWRDITAYINHDVFRGKYTSEKPGSRNLLTSYSALSNYSRLLSKRRISLLSPTKSHLITHRKAIKIANATLDDVCMPNGLHYRYFDQYTDSYTTAFQPDSEIRHKFEYKLSNDHCSLQKFLDPEMDHTWSNQILADQYLCPLDFSLDEFRALMSIPAGRKLRWRTMLTQFASPVIDMRKFTTLFFLFQSAFQAGSPSSCGDPRRENHLILKDDAFCTQLLSYVNLALSQIERNSECSKTLSCFARIASRIMSLNGSPRLVQSTSDFLRRARNVASTWLDEFYKMKQKASSSQQQQAVLRDVILDIALAIISTFDVEEIYIKELTNEDAVFMTYFKALMAIQESTYSNTEHDKYLSIQLDKFRRLAFRVSHNITRSIFDKHNQVLDLAVRWSWSAFYCEQSWERLPHSREHWLSTFTAAEDDSASLPVHFNILTGELLVNGMPLARLPFAYEQHEDYARLFGSARLEVMPSCLKGLKLSTKYPWSSHMVHFDLHDKTDTDSVTKPTIRIHTLYQNQNYELVPRDILASKFPYSLVEDHVHWYREDTRTIEFRLTEHAWSRNDSAWQLTKVGQYWQLKQNHVLLINPLSGTGKKISYVLNRLETLEHSHLTIDEHSGSLEIDLPRLGLGFRLSPGSCQLESREYRDYYVDEDQTLATLIGFKNRLILRNCQEPPQKLVMMISGEVQYARCNGVMEVETDNHYAREMRIYHIDNQLGYLKDDGTLYSKLFLAYIHSLTAHCLPDELTGRTGTAQAISILRSAALRSFDVLDMQSIKLLQSLAALVPRRQYYPAHLKEMQTVEWNSDLSYLSQNPALYIAVSDILVQAQDTSFLYPNRSVDIPKLEIQNQSLFQRDTIRNSTFRVADFGGESFTKFFDLPYDARDQNQNSENGTRSCIAATMIMHRTTTSHAELPASYAEQLWVLLQTQQDIPGTVNSPCLAKEDLDFDPKWLQTPIVSLSHIWCRLYQAIRRPPQFLNKYRIMFWLSTVAFASDLALIQVLAAIFNDERIRSIDIPTAELFRLSMGNQASKGQIVDLISPFAVQFESCPESTLPHQPYEHWEDAHFRKHDIYETRKSEAVELLSSILVSQWPSADLTHPHERILSTYLRVSEAMMQVREHWSEWVRNFQLFQHLRDVVRTVFESPVITVSILPLVSALPEIISTSGKRYISVDDLFTTSGIVRPIIAPEDITKKLTRYENIGVSEDLEDGLKRLIDVLKVKARSKFEHDYVTHLTDSYVAFKRHKRMNQSLIETTDVVDLLHRYLDECFMHASQLYDVLESHIRNSIIARYPAAAGEHFPTILPSTIIVQLSRSRWTRLPPYWKSLVVDYGLAITEVQRAQRLFQASKNAGQLLDELANVGHENWAVEEFPGSLLIEIESGILIRAAQEDIAFQMRNPQGNENSVMQFNMGLGKSSVIVPITAAAVANGSCLLRVIVAKPQSKQMTSMLVSKLGGIVNRRIYRFPISRNVKLNVETAEYLKNMCQECMETGGILLVQPEHLLSFKLMGLDTIIMGDQDLGRSLLSIEQFFKDHGRDIIDESDENFDVKFELVYAMGSQRTIEASPDRWMIIQRLLEMLVDLGPEIKKNLPESIEIDIDRRRKHRYPRIRLLRPDACQLLVSKLGKRICVGGLPGLPIGLQPEDVRVAIFEYITEVDLTAKQISRVETNSSIWSGSTKNQILILRGLLACGVLIFALQRKRWRVHYGLDRNRSPSTALAVPFRAKDQPATRAEFSHPDVVLILTLLTYYYEGLTDQELDLGFAHLFKSDQASAEYEEWIRHSPDLPTAFHSLQGVSIKGHGQGRNTVFTHLRYSKGAVDYFLSNIIFPKQMKEFPNKLSASGWDIGERKAHVTTGFSGTIDSRHLLPLSVHYLDLPGQKHTNCLVLQHLLRSENGVELMPSVHGSDVSEAHGLLGIVNSFQPPVRVILDVGAQIIELSNLTFAQEWLRECSEQEINAAIFVNDNDELSVVDRRGKIEYYESSHYSTHTEQCLVFLDQAHTRGIDIKLPTDYRAAVTLGADLTKDRLVQACMRMRKLGKGQSIIFCVNAEIQSRIRSTTGKSDMDTLEATDILHWVISETCADFQRLMPMWGVQGERHQRQSNLRSCRLEGANLMLETDVATRFLEAESKSLSARYGPDRSMSDGEDDSGEAVSLIRQRCLDFEVCRLHSASLYEEQERELSPEIQQECQIQRPQPAQPLEHRLHELIRTFAETGRLSKDCILEDAAISLNQCLQSSSAAPHLHKRAFSPNIYVTTDFARTVQVKSKFMPDVYQRSVHWILTSRDSIDPNQIGEIVIISPFEAEVLLPIITRQRVLTLHQYSIRSSIGFLPLDRLDLFIEGAPWNPDSLPTHLRMQLNLFAGQLYLYSYKEYLEFCDYLGIVSAPPPSDVTVYADGFLGLHCTGPFQHSPITFCKILFVTIRRHGQQAEKTHIGRIMNGDLLTEKDFEHQKLVL